MVKIYLFFFEPPEWNYNNPRVSNTLLQGKNSATDILDLFSGSCSFPHPCP